MTTNADSQWLNELFAFEYCRECGGDAEDHIPCVGPFGLPFAMCKFMPIVDGAGFRHGKVITL
jgi:hypothetical protein